MATSTNKVKPEAAADFANLRRLGVSPGQVTPQHPQIRITAHRRGTTPLEGNGRSNIPKNKPPVPSVGTGKLRETEGEKPTYSQTSDLTNGGVG